MNIPVKYRPPRALRALHMLLMAFLVIVPHNAAHADSHNATIRGELSALKALVTTADSLQCASPSCHIESSVIRLSLKAPHFARMNVKLVEAKLANPIRYAPQSADTASPEFTAAPILLRGYAYNSTEQDYTIPVAATLFRDDATPVLEVSLPQRPTRGTHDSRGLVVFRAPLSVLSSNQQRNSRVQAPPSWFFNQRGCGVEYAPPLSSQPYGPKRGGILRQQQLFNVIYVGTDYDSQFTTQVGCKDPSACNNRIISTVHKAAVFYQNQVGYTLEVARQFGPTQLGRETNSEVFLDSFQQYNFENRFQYVHTGSSTASNQVDIFQLFTGREMDSDTIGVAYVGTLCRDDQSRFAASIVQRVSDVIDPVTLAHEIGHSLSAVHTSTGIMRPTLGKNPPSTFASSSLLLLSNHVAQWYPQCRQGTSAGHIGPTPTPTSGGGSNDTSNPFRGKPVTVLLDISSSTPRSLTVTTTTSKLAAGCSVRLRLGTSAVGALRGPVISDVPSSEIAISKTGSAPFRVSPGPTRNPSVYFVAEHSCPDGSILEVSRVRRFNPNRIRGLSKKERSKRSWIRNFIATLQ
jgi:hypothetical protein